MAQVKAAAQTIASMDATDQRPELTTDMFVEAVYRTIPEKSTA